MSVAINAVGAEAYQIPLTSDPQQFEILLAGVNYTITSRWNDQCGFWFINIADSNGDPIASNIPLITGADCLDGLDYLEIDGSLYILTSGSHPDDVPTLDNLGTACNLYFVTVSTDE